MTEERKRILRRDWPQGVPTREIKKRMDQLPGDPVPLASLGYAAARLFVRRPKGHPRGAHYDCPPDADYERPDCYWDPVEATLEDVADWAASENMMFRSWDDLPAINARRERLYLAPYCRWYPTKGRRAA
jgi:hypothetical protein